MATNFKMTPEMIEELRTRIYTKFNVRHEFQALPEIDERREQKCSIHKSSKCPGHKATWIRGHKVYCDTCKKRCNKARQQIVNNRAEPALQAAIKHSTTKAKYEEALRGEVKA